MMAESCRCGHPKSAHPGMLGQPACMATIYAGDTAKPCGCKGYDAGDDRPDIALFLGTCPMKDDVYPEECCDEPEACRALARRTL